MKKIIILLFLFASFVGCSTNKVADSKTVIKKSDIVGYWLQIEENWTGDITDLTNNPYAYLEITDDKIIFYTISFDENEGYGEAQKYYEISDNKIYYDYDKLNNRSKDEIINSVYGGLMFVSFNESNLVLTEYSNNVNEDDGYTTNTYKKINASDWPIEE